MTRARMDWRNLRLEIRGHAGAGVKGSDLVCCAISTLGCALIDTLEEMKSEGITDFEWTGSPEQGYMMIEADPAQGRRAEVWGAFRMCVTGLRAVEQEYGDYIEVREDRRDGIPG